MAGGGGGLHNAGGGCFFIADLINAGSYWLSNC